jgi:actin related protein 2/3 complex subunit 2
MKDASLTFGEISSVSTFIETAVWSRVEAVKRSKEVAVGTPVGSSAVEFDDVRLHVNSVNGSSALEVSIGAPSGAFDAKSAREDAQKLLDGELVKVNERANSGYDLTASVDVDALAAIEDEAKRAEAVRQIARLRCVIYGSKLRKHLRTLAETGGEEGPLDWTTHRPRETMFIKPQNEQVTVVFPMRFEDARDAAIANTFLAQFAEVRRGQKDLSTAPAVSYHKTPPLELNDAPAGETNALDANGGYVSFVLFKRHCTAERLESTVWNIMTFYAFVSYHIKYSKAYWHSRMRAKVDSWLSILKRARKIDPNAEKKMVTASGRTFVRK